MPFSFSSSENENGEAGIRTLGPLLVIRSPSVRDRPLCHLSENSNLFFTAQTELFFSRVCLDLYLALNGELMVRVSFGIFQDHRLPDPRISAPLGRIVLMNAPLDIPGDADVERLVAAFDNIDMPGFSIYMLVYQFFLLG